MGKLNLVIFAAVVTMACSAAFALDIDLGKCASCEHGYGKNHFKCVHIVILFGGRIVPYPRYEVQISIFS